MNEGVRHHCLSNKGDADCCQEYLNHLKSDTGARLSGMGGTRGLNVSGLLAGLLGLGPNKGRDWTGCVGLGATG